MLKPLDYFAAPATAQESMLRRIKGDFRREWVAAGIASGGLAGVPAEWCEHELSEALKAVLQTRDPRARGGEDLPDLLGGEVEIARLSQLDSNHGEVTSLRARPGTADATGRILLRMVDEYGIEFDLTRSWCESPLTGEEVLELFVGADPSPVDEPGGVSFRSDFYPELDNLAAGLGFKA